MQCRILRGPRGERIVDIVPGGTELELQLTHCGRVTQICVFNTVKLGTFASSP